MSVIGLLNVHKPPGVTSRDIVNRVQRLLPRRTKVGHAGTLDPIASGVLMLCIGRATRLIPYLQRMPKAYRGTFQLGCESASEDTEGEVTQRPDDPRPTMEAIQSALPAFMGEILQRPPAFSALKVNGQRAYDLARSGQQVELKPRPITIHQLEIVEFEYPRLVLDIRCGSGTYVRSLGRDIAESLGTAAVMSGLVRTAIGEFDLAGAVKPPDLTVDTFDEHLLPYRLAAEDLPHVTVNADEIGRIANGLSISDRFGLADDATCPQEVAALDAEGQLVAILVPGRGNDRKGWGPLRNFADVINQHPS